MNVVTLPLLNQGVDAVPLCHYCEHYSFKCFWDLHVTEGKCFGFPEEELSRWVKSSDTCDRFKLDIRMITEQAKFVTQKRFLR